MKKYEYQSFDGVRWATLGKALAQKGNEGWLLVGLSRREFGMGDADFCLVFAREIEATSLGDDPLGG